MFTLKLLTKLCICSCAAIVAVDSAVGDDRVRWEFAGGHFYKSPSGQWIVVQQGNTVATLNQVIVQKDFIELASGDQEIMVRLYGDRSEVYDKRFQPTSWRPQYQGKWMIPQPAGPPPQSLALPRIFGTWKGSNQLFYEVSQANRNFSWTVASNGESANGTVSPPGSLTVTWINKLGPVNGLTGKITQTDALGLATRIEWSNFIIFERHYGGAPGAAFPAVPASVDISGRWTNQLGIRYDVIQNGNGFTWTVPGLLLETVHGTVFSDHRITANVGNLFGAEQRVGRITNVDANNRASEITWDNNVVFRR